MIILFFFNATTTTEIYTLSLHDALPISCRAKVELKPDGSGLKCVECKRVYPIRDDIPVIDRKSTRLNSSHGSISYAVFCLKKKKQERTNVNGVDCRISISDWNRKLAFRT